MEGENQSRVFSHYCTIPEFTIHAIRQCIPSLSTACCTSCRPRTSGQMLVVQGQVVKWWGYATGVAHNPWDHPQVQEGGPQLFLPAAPLNVALRAATVLYGDLIGVKSPNFSSPHPYARSMCSQVKSISRATH